ncbi:MAG: CDC27 family protein [Sulfurimonas sp.]|jgi:tetratricopeptide (TPR) repeat protein
MLNVNDLEARHKKYKIKSYTPYFVIFASVTVAVISITSFILYNSKIEEDIEKEEQKQPVVVQKIEVVSATKEKNETLQEVEQKTVQEAAIEPATAKEDIKAEQKQEKVSLSPSLDFIGKIGSNNQVYYKNETINTAQELPKEVTIDIKQEEKKQEEKIVPKKVEKVEEVTINIDKKTPINIARKDEQDDVSQVVKRFNVNHNPALSLFVAKKYYQLSNYEQAYNYALITNEINNNIEESWIIFSKSLVKMNKKEEAIDTLKRYISYSHSSQAKQLLDEISSGKFK